MRILITGGAGYKGSLLARKLLNEGHTVIIIDNFIFGTHSLLDICTHSNLTIVRKDIRNIVKTDLESIDVVIHLAAIVGFPACAANEFDAVSINLEATKKLVSLLDKKSLLIYASTTSVYGATNMKCSEDISVNPKSLYAETKYKAEKSILEHGNSIVLRFATVFGVSPRMRTTLLVNDFVYKALHDKHIVLFDENAKRCFIHIQDAVDAYIFSLKNYPKLLNQIFNVGNEELSFSKLDIANHINKIIPFEIISSQIPDLDKRNFEISFSKFEKFGFKTKFTLDFGIYELKKCFSFYYRNIIL